MDTAFCIMLLTDTHKNVRFIKVYFMPVNGTEVNVDFIVEWTVNKQSSFIGRVRPSQLA